MPSIRSQTDRARAASEESDHPLVLQASFIGHNRRHLHMWLWLIGCLLPVCFSNGHPEPTLVTAEVFIEQQNGLVLGMCFSNGYPEPVSVTVEAFIKQQNGYLGNVESLWLSRPRQALGV